MPADLSSEPLELKVTVRVGVQSAVPVCARKGIMWDQQFPRATDLSIDDDAFMSKLKGSLEAATQPAVPKAYKPDQDPHDTTTPSFSSAPLKSPEPMCELHSPSTHKGKGVERLKQV